MTPFVIVFATISLCVRNTAIEKRGTVATGTHVTARKAIRRNTYRKRSQ